MIAKTVTGCDFNGALAYGAGLRASHVNKQAELLSVANIGSQDAQGIAAEMQAVAALSGRIHKPVWHTVLSWAPTEQVSREQKLKAAALYCELMGASLERHQVAVYEHKDKNHPHLHIYINRVPVDGGAALDTAQNYVRNVKVTRQIRQQLGMQALPVRHPNKLNVAPSQEATCNYVHDTLITAMQDPAINSLDTLLAYLETRQIKAYLKRDRKGVLVGTSFCFQESQIKGTDIGVRAKHLRDLFRSYGREALRPTDFRLLSNDCSWVENGAPCIPSGGLSGSLLNIEALKEENSSAGVEDAERNDNTLRKKKRRPKL